MIRKVLGLLLASGLVIGASSSANALLPPAQVFIVTGSNINMVSRESKLPVSIQNNYDRSVKVRVHAKSTNSAVRVQEYVSVTVPAKSRKDALLPITVVSGGQYTLKVWVTTFTDIRIGDSIDLNVNANPDVELVILLSFGAFIVLLLSLGVIRMVRRNKVKT